MPLSIDIAGTERRSQCELRSLNITSTIMSNASQAQMTVHVPDRSWHPKAANVVIIATSSDGYTHFGGTISEVEEEMSGQTGLRYHVSMHDYTDLFDRVMVTTNYLTSGPTTSLAVDEIVAHITQNYTTGFSTGDIQTGLGTAAQQRYDYVYPSDAIRGLANQFQALFWIDSTKGIHFQSAGVDPAPISAIDLDSYTTSANWSDFRLREAASNIKNRIVLQGYKTKSTVSFQNIFTGNGTQQFFPLGYEASGVSTGDIQVTLNSATLTPMVDNVDGSPSTTAGSTSQIFICYVNLGARTDFAPTSTETLTLTYTYMQDSGFQSDDPAAQTEMAAREGGDGVHMYMINDPSLTNFQANDNLAIAQGQALTARYGKPLLQGEFDSFTQGWERGQYLTVSSTNRMGGFTKTMFVYQIDKKMINHPGTTGTPTWKYHVTVGESALPL